MLSNTIIFFIASQISYCSIIGYGSFLRRESLGNIWLDNFINFFIGLVFLSIIGQLFYYLNLNFKLLNLVILILGFCFFFTKNDRKIFIRLILLNALFFSGLLISKLHEDWPYHFNFIEQISAHKPIIGIGNVDDIHILSSSFFSYIQKFFNIPLFDFKFVMIPVYLVYLNLITLLIKNIYTNSKKLSQIYIIILTVLIIKFSRISEFGYDYLSNIILLQIFILYLINHFNNENNNLFKNIYILLFLYAVSIKITALFFTPLLIYFYFSDLIRDKKIVFYNLYNLLFILFLISLVIESFLRSGCFIYFFEASCLNQNLVSWSIDYQRVLDHSSHVELWAKGFYIQEMIKDPSIYLNLKNWLLVWINKHFFYKIFEFSLIPFFLITYFLIRERIGFEQKYFFLFLASVLSLFLWFYYLPQLRFGSTIILIFLISLYLLFSKINSDYVSNKKKYFIFISILIIFFNIKNFDRIKDEYQRNDIHKFTNFPFPPEKRIMESKISNNSIKFRAQESKTINIYNRFIIID